MDKIQYLNYIKDKYKIQPMVRNIFIIGTPSHGNLGDHAIWYATWKLLREMYATANIVDILIEDFFAEIDAIYELTQDQDLIILQGGGNLGNCYMDDEMIRRYVLLRFQKNQIILFPQTVYFTDDKKGKEELKKSIMIYNSHPNLTLMGRDHVSTCFLKEHFNASIYEAFDVVLTMSAKSEQSRRGALICLRNDSESSLPDPRRKEIISRIERICPELRITDTMDESFAWREEREERVLKKIQEFQMAQIVITDRLHGMIFSAITGTPCIVLNNNNSKVKNCYEKLRNLKYIQFIDDTSSLERDFKSLSKTKENIFDSNSYKEQIKNMISENFADDMWEKYIQTADISNTQYRLVNAYYEVEQFIQKATNGQYSFDDINVDDNGKITGLPEKMCKIMNSQEANAKYEEIRDNIYMLTDYKNQYGLEDILAFKAGYNISDSEVSTVGTSGNNSVMDNAGYYKNMKTII